MAIKAELNLQGAPIHAIKMWQNDVVEKCPGQTLLTGRIDLRRPTLLQGQECAFRLLVVEEPEPTGVIKCRLINERIDCVMLSLVEDPFSPITGKDRWNDYPVVMDNDALYVVVMISMIVGDDITEPTDKNHGAMLFQLAVRDSAWYICPADWAALDTYMFSLVMRVVETSLNNIHWSWERNK